MQAAQQIVVLAVGTAEEGAELVKFLALQAARKANAVRLAMAAGIEGEMRSI
jgi:hypothetical protein